MTQKYQDPLVKDNFLSKMNSTLMERHGVSWSFHMADFKKKYQETIQKNYGHGIVHNSMIPEYREINKRRLISASYSIKDYIWPSGRISKIQGYEDIALDDLLVIFDESEIQIFSETGKPPIKYFDPEGKSRNYYPDIFIPKLNTIIEVKSQYTFEKDLDINILKKDSCVNNGYIFSWMIYHDRKSKKLDTINFSFV